MVSPQLWISFLKAYEAHQIPSEPMFKMIQGVNCSEWACICCEPDLVLIATVQNLKKKKKGIKITLKNPLTSQVARSRGALVWDCVSVFWRCLCPSLGLAFREVVYLLLLCANACLLSLAVGRLHQTAICHFLVVPKLLKTNTLSTTSQPNVSYLFLSLNLNLLMPWSLAAKELRAAGAVTLMSKKNQIQILVKVFCWKLPSMQGFRLSAFKLTWEPGCHIAKLNQSATSAASKCPVVCF